MTANAHPLVCGCFRVLMFVTREVFACDELWIVLPFLGHLWVESAKFEGACRQECHYITCNTNHAPLSTDLRDVKCP
ncbi:hypothetical protein L596_021056 [Steinernema carpocapsae]|uniref:Secreted protein n=1 Tax=Steinernema carpocapsae TaxID=34508 RepID=A0A4V6A130_STECR|nr:hypothetical protein L596_021056 [Steinernema carpocapsae]